MLVNEIWMIPPGRIIFSSTIIRPRLKHNAIVTIDLHPFIFNAQISNSQNISPLKKHVSKENNLFKLAVKDDDMTVWL